MLDVRCQSRGENKFVANIMVTVLALFLLETGNYGFLEKSVPLKGKWFGAFRIDGVTPGLFFPKKGTVVTEVVQICC